MQNNDQKRMKIIGMGVYVPEKVLTNADLEKMVETSDEWIVSRSGIRERHVARPDQATSDLGVEAARAALADAGLGIEAIDLILVATNTPDTIFPSTACWIQRGLKAGTIPAFDISAGCTGFLYGLIISEGLIRSGTAGRVLLVAPEMLTKVTNWEDRSTCFLFGDAAGAVVLEAASDGSGMLSHYWQANGNLADLLSIPAGGTRIPATQKTVEGKLHYLQMKGNEVFKHAVKHMCEAALEALKIAGLKIEDITWLIPHQANIRIIEATGERLRLPKEKVFVNIHKYGNVSVATIPLAIHELKQGGKLKKGDILLLDAFGAGFTWAAIAYRW